MHKNSSHAGIVPCHILGLVLLPNLSFDLRPLTSPHLEQHVLLLGHHVHVILIVVAAEVDGLQQDVLIPTHLQERGEREREREREREKERECITG